MNRSNKFDDTVVEVLLGIGFFGAGYALICLLLGW